MNSFLSFPLRKFASSLNISRNNITSSNISRIVSSSFNSSNNVIQIDCKRNYCNSITRNSDNDKLIDERFRLIDTTLTPAQRAHVDSIRKLIRGGPNSPRSIYREVPLPEEIQGQGNFLPKIAENADALIDYALSHLPEKGGYRGSRKKKRMALRFKNKEFQDKRRKAETIKAKLVKDQKAKVVRAKVKEYKLMAQVINEKNAKKQLKI